MDGLDVFVDQSILQEERKDLLNVYLKYDWFHRRPREGTNKKVVFFCQVEYILIYHKKKKQKNILWKKMDSNEKIIQKN